VVLQNTANHLSVDPEGLSSIVSEISQAFGTFQDSLHAFNQDVEGQMMNATSKGQASIHQMDAFHSLKIDSLDKMIAQAEKASYVESTFVQDLLHAKSYHNSKAAQFIQSAEDIAQSVQARDYASIGVAMVQAFERKKAGIKENEAQTEFYKKLGNMAKGAGSFGILQVGLMAMKQYVGLLYGINNMAAEFNEALIETHGMVSLGYDLTHEVEFDATETFSKFRTLFNSFGADSKTAISPEKLMSMTGAYEEVGIKMKTLAANKDELDSTFNVALTASMRSGIALEKVSGLQAGWKRNLGMDARMMELVLRKSQYAFEATGVPAEMYLDALQNSEYDVDGWGDSLYSLLDLQEAFLSRKTVTKGASMQAFQVFMGHLNSMPNSKWVELSELLVPSELAAILMAEEERARELMNSATDETQRKKAEHALWKLTNSRKASDPTFRRRIVGLATSAEAKIAIMRKAVENEMGTDFIDKLRAGGVLSMPEEHHLMSILGFSGDRTGIEKMKIAIAAISDPKFDYKKMRETLKKATKEVGADDLKKLNAAILAAYAAQVTSEDAIAALINKYMTPMINTMETILSYVRAWWRKIQTGSSTDPAARDKAKKNIFEALDELATTKDPIRKAALLNTIHENSKTYMDNAGRASEIKAYASGKNLNVDILSQVKAALQLPEGGTPGLNYTNGGEAHTGSMSEAGITMLKQFEGFRAHAYPDGKNKKGEIIRYSIGYGTRASGSTEKIDEAEATRRFKGHVGGIEQMLNESNVPMTQGQYDALVSFLYNSGAGHFPKLKKILMGGDFKAAEQYMRVRNKSSNAQGQITVNDVLVDRRKKEIEMFRSGQGGSAPSTPTTVSSAAPSVQQMAMAPSTLSSAPETRPMSDEITKQLTKVESDARQAIKKQTTKVQTAFNARSLRQARRYVQQNEVRT